MLPASPDAANFAPANLGPGKKKNNRKKSKNALAKEAAAQAAATASGQQSMSKVPDALTATISEEPDAVSSPRTQGIPLRPALNTEEPASQTNGTSKHNSELETVISSSNDSVLQTEIEQLKQQLAIIQETHDAKVAQLKTEVEEATTAKDEAEEKYEVLLDRVEKIKSTVAERFSRDRAELEEAKERMDELGAQSEELRTQADQAEQKAQSLNAELQQANRELQGLRSRNNLSAQNWSKEKDDLIVTNQHLREELQETTSAMGEWEVIAMEERALKDSFADKVGNLEEQLGQLNETFLSVSATKDQQDQSIDQLQRALAELQDTRRRELREMVESHEEQIKELKRTVYEAEKKLGEAVAEKETLTKELARTASFEKEVNEKNLLIGKLRHEAIVLNEHLTKALRYLKKTKPQDQVDRQIVTNQLVHFLSLDRSDPKRFQILQVMASYLQFTDQEREQAGLARPGTSINSLRLPASPFTRTPSSPSLHTEFFTNPDFSGSSGQSSKETLAELWASFLERSAEEGVGSVGTTKSRKDSISSAGTRADSTRG